MDKIPIGRKDGKDITKYIDWIIMAGFIGIVIYAQAQGTYNKHCLNIKVTQEQWDEAMQKMIIKDRQYTIKTTGDEEWQKLWEQVKIYQTNETWTIEK